MAVGANEQEPSGESLPPNAALPQDDAAPTQPVDTGEQTTPAHEASTPHPPEEPAPKDARPRDEQGRFAPGAGSDPVQDAIAKLAKPALPEAAPKPAPAATPPEKPSAAKPEAKPAKPDTLTTDPLADLNPSDDEKARWSPRTKERFDKVFSRTREVAEQLKNAEPDIASGKEFNKLIDDFKLREDIGFVPPENLAALVRAQASVNRALIAMQQGRRPAPQDVEALSDLGADVDSLRTKLGVAPAQPDPAEIAPFTGELPADLKDLVDVYGIDEKRVRLLASLETRAKAPTPQVTPQAQPAPAPQVQQAPPRPQGVDMEQLYTRRFLGELTASGDQNPAQTLRILLAHPATKTEVMRRFPGTSPADVPAVFDSLDPKERHDVLTAARRSMTPQVPVRSSSNPPPPTHQRTLSPTAARPGAAPVSDDPVLAAIARLSRE